MRIIPSCCADDRTVNNVQPFLFMSLMLTMFSPRQVMKYVKLSKRHQAPDRMNFLGYQKAPYGLHNSCVDSWFSKFSADTLTCQSAQRLFVIPRAWEQLTFPIGSWRTSSGALCPLHLCWFAQLKWDKAHRGACGDSWGRTGRWVSRGFYSPRLLTDVQRYCKSAAPCRDWHVTKWHTSI